MWPQFVLWTMKHRTIPKVLMFLAIYGNKSNPSGPELKLEGLSVLACQQNWLVLIRGERMLGNRKSVSRKWKFGLFTFPLPSICLSLCLVYCWALTPGFLRICCVVQNDGKPKAPISLSLSSSLYVNLFSQLNFSKPPFHWLPNKKMTVCLKILCEHNCGDILFAI